MVAMVSDVVIAGAGIGGLTLAVALRRRGIRVRVFERARELGAVGAGIALPANGVRGLAALGLSGVAACGASVTGAVILDARGRRLGPMVDLSEVYAEIGASLVAAHRSMLHAFLLDAVGPGTVMTGARVEAFEQDEARAHVVLESGERVDTELLVGADGLHSAVRSQLVGDGAPRYSGYTSWRGVTPSGAVPVQANVSESWGRGARFGIVPIGFGEIYWFATADAAPGGRDEDVGRELLQRFKGWHEPIARIIAATPGERIVRTDICDRDPILEWHRGRVVLLGDAAHPMTPNLGQGAGQAIEDTVVLDACLSAGGSLEEALTTYERRRVARANSMVRASRRFGEVAQWRHPVAAWLRDRVFSLMPASMAIAQARRLMQTDF
jgi:2-polyprenyl-6-methoxyphenol hydroxylase-like FAD-dependent oxidoreductase